ncbi:MerR family transcriptional regulator [Streptomyces sp. NPDC093249]|uniref:MerR family transcriptional regulator n=1 Tax=unclassified Streptomyces TaxID=2593676 RepID=UPI0037F935EE
MTTYHHGPLHEGAVVVPGGSVATLYTTTEAAEQATRWRHLLTAGSAAVTPATIRSWARRGHLVPTGLDDHDRPLYTHANLARAEAATRGRALRLVGVPEPRR